MSLDDVTAGSTRTSARSPVRRASFSVDDNVFDRVHRIDQVETCRVAEIETEPVPGTEAVTWGGSRGKAGHRRGVFAAKK
jgi:hypothetical protein